MKTMACASFGFVECDNSEDSSIVLGLDSLLEKHKQGEHIAEDELKDAKRVIKKYKIREGIAEEILDIDK